MKKLKKIADAVNQVYEHAGVVLLVILTVACILQVFSRKVLGSSFRWTEELARFCFIWVSLLGVSLCVARGGHAAVDLLNNALKGRVKQIHTLILQCIILIVAVILLVQGWKMVGLTAKQLSPALHLKMSYIYLAIPVSAAGMIFNILVNAAALLTGDTGETCDAESDTASGTTAK